MIDVMLQPDGCCIVRFSGDDALFVVSPSSLTPENRARMEAILILLFKQLTQLNPQMANDLLEKKARFVYNLFLRYWNPEREHLIIDQLKHCLLTHAIEVYEDACGQTHVNIMMHRGQTQFVRLLLDNANTSLLLRIHDPQTLSRLYHTLSSSLEYRRHGITAKSMRNTLVRLINKK